MSVASHELRDVPRRVGLWAGAIALVLLGACGGEQRETVSAGTGGAADTAPAAVADTAATSGDTAARRAADTVASGTAGSAGRDTASRPSAPAKAPAAPGKPAVPDQTAAKPAQPKPRAPDTAAAVADRPPTAQADTPATARADSAPAQDETATAPLRDAYHQAPKDTVDQATYDGWKQYNLNCARCHGEDVLGSTIAPHLVTSLKPNGPINTQELFVQTVCAGRPEKGMPSWCALGMEPAKINQIYAYVKGRSDGKIGPGRPAVKAEGS